MYTSTPKRFDSQGAYLALLICFAAGSNYVHDIRQTNIALERSVSSLEARLYETDTKLQGVLLTQRVEAARLNASVAFIQHSNKKISLSEAKHIAALEIKYSKMYHVPLSLGLAISYQESKFVSKAVSYNGTSFGVKQVNRSVWAEGVPMQMLQDKDYNIKKGYEILKQYRGLTSSWYAATMRYYGSTNKLENIAYADSVDNIRKRIYVE